MIEVVDATSDSPSQAFDADAAAQTVLAGDIAQIGTLLVSKENGACVAHCLRCGTTQAIGGGASEEETTAMVDFMAYHVHATEDPSA